MEIFSTFIPMDRRQALALGQAGDLPDRAEGTALFADISGSTPLAEAQEFFEQSLRIDREVGARSSEMMPLGNLAIIANARGDYSRGRKYAEQAYQLAREMGDRYAQSRILGILGTAYSSLGQYLEASKIFQEALRLDQETGDRQDELHRLDSLGYTSILLGDLEQARTFYEAALRLSREVGDRDGEAFSEHGLCLLFLYLGETETARDHGKRALTILQEVGDAGEQAAIEPHAGLARAALEQGDTERALFHVQAVLDRFELGKLYGLDEPFRVYLTCYVVLQAAGDPLQARKILQAGCGKLQEQLAGLDEVRHRQFLENVPPNREFAAACNLDGI